jgi:hypothetical protein
MKKLLTLIFIILITASVYSQNYKQVKIYINSPNDIEALIVAGLEFDHLNLSKDNAINVFISDEEYSILQSTSFRFEVLIDDWYEHYNNLPKLTEIQKAEFVNKSKMEMNVSGFGYGSMGGFYTLAEVIAELDSMKALSKSLKYLSALIETRPIYMVCF